MTTTKCKNYGQIKKLQQDSRIGCLSERELPETRKELYQLQANYLNKKCGCTNPEPEARK